MTRPVVLLPLDGSKTALAALPVAKAFSALEGAPLRVLHASDGPAPPLAELASRLGLDSATLRTCSVEVRPGAPADAILAAARETPVRLVVMCTHSWPVPGQNVLGATALTVLTGAPCPVVLVNPEHGPDRWALRTVLLPYEGAPVDSGAVRLGAELARRTDAELVVLQVAAAGVAAPQQQGSFLPPAYLDQPQHEWPSWAEEFMERLACECPLAGLRVRILIGRGAPGAEISRVARERAADLIVLAWKGRWGPSRAETLKTILREAPCPVMAVRL